MNIRSFVLIALAATASAAPAQTGAYSSTFSDYQSWKDGAPADWRAVNRSVAATDAHAGHGVAAPSAGHDHGGTASAGHAHGRGKAGMADMHKKMHGDARDHGTSAMHEKMHGKAAGHDHGAAPEKKP